MKAIREVTIWQKRERKQERGGSSLFFRRFLFLFLFIFLMAGTISAFEFDNVKNYDSETKTVDIRNSVLGIPFLQLDQVAEVKLITEEHRIIHNSDDYVMEWEIENFGEYSKFIKEMNSYKNDKNGDELDIKYKYKYFDEKIGTHNELKYKEIDLKNGTIIQEPYYEEIQGSWVELNALDNLPEGTFKIRVYLDSEIPKNQQIELVPTLFGVEIDEWATYALEEYYDINDNTYLSINVGSLGAMLAQTFTPDSDELIAKVELKIYSHGNEGTLYGCVANTTDGTTATDPNTASSVATFKNVTTGTLVDDDDTQWYNLTFSDNNASLANNVTYAIVLLSTGADGNNEYRWRVDQAGATYEYGFKNTQDGGGGWARDEDGDFMFRTFSTTPPAPPDSSPVVTPDYPINTTNQTTSTVTINATVSDNYNVSVVNLYVDGILNQTNSSLGVYNNSVFTFTVDVGDGTSLFYISATDNNSQTTNGATRYVNVDLFTPQIEIFNPNTTIRIDGYVTNETVWNGLNYSVNDSHLDSCWYSVDGGTTNTSLASCANVTRVYFPYGFKTYDVWVNDTFGKTNHSAVTKQIQYKVLEIGNNYTHFALEGSTQTFTLNVSIGKGYNYSSGVLYYNKSSTGLTSTYLGDNNYSLTDTLAMPLVSTDYNASFSFNITLNNSNMINSSYFQQRIEAMDIDNCTTNGWILYNFTMKNEETQVAIPNDILYNTTADLNLQIYSYSTETEVINYSHAYDAYNPFYVCLNDSLDSNQYNVYLQVQYAEKYGAYATEFYHLQNETLDNDTFGTKITLYDLNESDSQIFSINAKDSAYLDIGNAIIEVYRKYIDEGEYKIVEIPKTSGSGIALAHLVNNDAIYRFVVKRFGETLIEMEDIIPYCENPTTEDCEMIFVQSGESVTIPDFSGSQGLSYTLSYNNNTRTVSSTFLLTDTDVAEWVSLNVTQNDALGTSVCTDDLVATSGTLSCVVPNSIGNSTVSAKIFREGIYIGGGSISLRQLPEELYGTVLIFLSLFTILTLIGASMTNDPVITTIFLMLGVILMIGINLIANNGFIGAGSSLLFLFFAVIIVMIKGGKMK